MTRIAWTIAMLAFGGMAMCQSVEAYAGHKRAGVDLMWFKFWKKPDGSNSNFLYFSRNRASVDYDNKSSLMGSTNAVSYNFRNGIGLVTVASFVSSGLKPKAGVQFYRQKGNFMFFGWAVADLLRNGNVDVFGMFRLQPPIRADWKYFLQAELFPVFTPDTEYWNLTERLRAGIRYRNWAWGAMLDLNHSGTSSLNTTSNAGIFLRHDF